MHQGFDAKRGMDGVVFMPYPRKKQDQQPEDGKNGSHLIQQVRLYHGEVAWLTIKTGKCKDPGDQPFGFVSCKIGIKHRQPDKEQEQAGNSPAG